MPQYTYSLLPLESDSIRLLRLKPNKDKSADIQCELFEYSLQASSGTHLYEALSYVWGDPEKKPCIFMNGCSFHVTDNLHAALLQLRNHSMERVLWVDAICIDQANQKEKETQIQLMAKIYGQANRVIVWLGEAAEDSDRALDEIRITRSGASLSSPNNGAIQNSVLALLQRSWFRRIWVLQEVAAARNITIACGSAEIDGHAFCLGVDSLMGLYDAPPDLQGTISSVTYLIRGAMFRPRGLGWVSNEICSLGELIDMYHTHEATLQSDKVYALLGMSSDNFHETGLAPDYNVPWKDLFEALLRHILGKTISMEVLPERASAIIKGKGYILGSISSVRNKDTWNGKQDVGVVWGGARVMAGEAKGQSIPWTLHPSAKQIMTGDIICLFQGAPKPSVIRFHGDHWTIITVAVKPPRVIREGSEDVEWSRYLQKTDYHHNHNLQCIWDWDTSPGVISRQENYGTSQDSLDRVIEVWRNALMLVAAGEYRKAEDNFQHAMESFEKASREGCIFDFSAEKLSFTNNVDLNLMNESFIQPPLSWAAKMGYEAVVKLLIRRLNADVNFRNKTNWTALQEAAHGGHLTIVERLLQKKADVNAAAVENWKGRTALQAAAGRGHLAVVKRLLQEKADVNAAASYSGRTALQVAAQEGHLTIVRRLLQERADVNAAAGKWSGRTALQAAAERGHLAVVKRLLQEKADVNAAASYSGRTALQAAAGEGHLAVVKRLLQERADVNAAAAELDGRTALQAAAGGGHLEVVERLLQEKADVNAKAGEHQGRTALQAAAEGGHLAVVEQLLQEKADVNAVRGWDDRTALQAAAEWGHLAVVERLLQEKADVNAVGGRHRRTALQEAAGGGRLAVVERLLEYKAHVSTDALEYAALRGHLAVVKRLLREKPEGVNLAYVKRLLKENGEVDA